MFCLKICLESNEIYKNCSWFVKFVPIFTCDGIRVTFSISTLPKTFANAFSMENGILIFEEEDNSMPLSKS